MYRMRNPRKPRILILLLLLLLAIAYFVLSPFRSPSSDGPSTSRDGPSSASEPGFGEAYRGRSSADINRVTNATLGFGKIMVVGLPERTDKRDAMALMSALTGFEIQWVDGVRGESVAEKARPFGYKGSRLTEAYMGSWRGHMNAIRR
jgi:hypothetical protein